MTKKEVIQEFRKIDHELRVNKPRISPYPPNLVRRREFLILAQVHLNNVLNAKLKNDRLIEKFETQLYKSVKEIYYNWY